VTAEDPPGGLQAVQAWHPNVHEDDIGSKFLDLGDGGDAIGGLAHYVKVRLGLEDQSEPAPNQRLIVDDEDADHDCTDSSGR
jgi:hypothetical protein